MPYVIRNCPARLPSGFCIEAPKKKAYLCQNCTDCKLKQIVELCKDVENIENVKTLYDAAQSGMFLQANKILKLLDIEECE